MESLQSRIDGLWQALEAVTDPRNARGLRYRLPLLLSLAVLAVAAGAKTFLEIAEISADLPTRLPAELGVCSWSGTPSNWTFSRVLAKVDHDELDLALSGWRCRRTSPLRRSLSTARRCGPRPPGRPTCPKPRSWPR
ncbi:transposase family protein [Saccharopolyspora sp. ASAGF58]|uniref:transposase family protein n=1 Tax=Saccharopolyspora sp. ASAGF58 TaxID=2719023 RepID=UPI0014466AF5|nr:transposase family protein [Saccharopolyspora sp. ASAGF58]